MKIAVKLVAFVCTFLSCSNNETDKLAAKEAATNYTYNTPLETIKSQFLYLKGNGLINPSTETGYLVGKYFDNIISSLKIVDSIRIPDTKLYAIFYSYSIKADVNNSFCYMRKIDSTWRIHDGYYYYSEYSDKDPFKNGKGKEAKELLDKREKWLEGSNNFFLKID